MLSLSKAVCSIMKEWNTVFKQDRTMMRAIRLAFCLLLNPSRNTITQSRVYGGLEDLDWSSDYKLLSRAKWKDEDLFVPVIEEVIPYFNDDYICLAVDDTKVKKTGKKIPLTQYFMDAMSPAFRYNLIWGHRILQFSALLPLYEQEEVDLEDEDKLYHVSRGIPVSATNVPAVKKPGKNASDDEIEAYKRAKRKNNLCLTFVEIAKRVRASFDQSGAEDKTLLIVADGSFCNSTVFKADLQGIKIAARCRKDATLCHRAEDSPKRYYAKETFSPLSVRQDEKIPYKKVKLFIGKKLRTVKYKEVKNVLWRRGAGRQELRLIVIAPKPYKSYGRKQNYKQEAYILTNDDTLSAEFIIQQYINRWEIEVNHRDEKNNLGLGQAQVWNINAVVKAPALLIAAYSIMLLMSLKCYGIHRSDGYLPQPKWRKGSIRPSCNDMVNLLRRELAADEKLQEELKLNLNRRLGVDVNR
jgi:hypothetical protein